jgi:ABC-2 type transport system ATP-binding protein
MNQRLGLALILLNEPQLVILDEPTTGLDPQGMKEIRDLILELARRRGVTVFLSSHLLYEIELIATRMAILHQGRLRVEGSVDSLLKQGPASVEIRTESPAELAAFLKAQPAYHTAVAGEGGVTVGLDPAEIPELNRRLVQAGFAISGLIPRRSLETYFLNLIEGHGAQGSIGEETAAS